MILYWKLNVRFRSCILYDFRRLRPLLSWLVYTPPEIANRISRFAQVTERTFSSHYMKEPNSTVRLVKCTSDIGLRYVPLYYKSLRMQCYVDTSFATNEDLSSQIGFILVLADNTDRCHILENQSQKSHHVVQSSMTAETYAFVEGFDRSYLLANDLKRSHGSGIKLMMLTDLLWLFDALTRGSVTDERRLVIDILAARQFYKQFEI